MTLKEMWKKRMELWNEGEKLWDEGERLYSRGRKGTGCKLCDKGRKLWYDSNILFYDFIDKNYGVGIKEKNENDRVILSNGIILYHDGRVYEPLEVIMREIIKKHEEVVQVGGNDE